MISGEQLDHRNIHTNVIHKRNLNKENKITHRNCCRIDKVFKPAAPPVTQQH